MRFGRLGRWHLSLGVAFLLVGLLVGIAFRTQQRWQLRDAVRKQRLVDVVRSQEKRAVLMQAQLKAARARVSAIETEAAKRRGELSSFTAETKRLSVMAGLTPISGDGVQIVIGDAARVPSNGDPFNYVVHDYDLQILVNAVWGGGARAVAINGERLTSITGIRGAGATILVNNKPIGSPYKIVAIGPLSPLVRAIRTDPDARQLLGTYARSFDLVTHIAKGEKLSVPPYRGAILFMDLKTGGSR